MASAPWGMVQDDSCAGGLACRARGQAPPTPLQSTHEDEDLEGQEAPGPGLSEDWYDTGAFSTSGYSSDGSSSFSMGVDEHCFGGPNAAPRPREEHEEYGASCAGRRTPLQQAQHKQPPAGEEERTMAEQAQRVAPAAADPLSPSEIYRILNDEGEETVPRPDFITNESAGRIFVEHTSGRPGLQRIRRRKGVDQWKQGMELVPKIVPGVTCGKDGKGEVWVKSSYGNVIRAGLSGDSSIRYLYHMHELHYFYQGKAAAEALAEQQALKAEALAKKSARKAGASAGVSFGDPKRKRSAVKACVSQPDWIKGTLFHFRGSSATRTTSHKLSCTGRLELRLEPGEKRWIQFVDAQGESKGGVDLGSKGPRLSGASGDFAEYHPRDPTQQPFEEGDLVGFGPAGLTRKTKGSRQLGVISRQAIVVGSVPTESDLVGWDTVAYVGKVPVKLLGGARRDDFLMPSGKEDGTAVATSGVPDATIGRALHDYATLHAVGENDGVLEASSTWQLAEASVVPPVQSVRSNQANWQQIQLVAICCGMTALVVATEFAGRQMRPVVVSATSLLHVADSSYGQPALPLALPLLKLALLLVCTGVVLHKFTEVYPRAARRLCLQAASTWPCTLLPCVATSLLKCSNKPQVDSLGHEPLRAQAQTRDTNGEAGGVISAMDEAVEPEPEPEPEPELATALLHKSDDGRDDEARDEVLDKVLQQHIGGVISTMDEATYATAPAQKSDNGQDGAGDAMLDEVLEQHIRHV